MGETLSAQVISLGARVVVERPGAVKIAPASRTASTDLLKPSFEIELTAGPRLWLRRLLWRCRLRAAFHGEADAVLEDFGLSRETLERYLAQPFWRA
ncbi:hypothetical protein SAMN05428997_11429 [Bosea sp. CRIB-10]|uniref:hypothetical protein n=1 Tax=Bosea sp. CRIB-10 TaxID=378404 RepID=UPI0008DF15B6|nr:hypothetical protein [Bosea sp. CRIB-10]SFC93598.1 hypothetical protein SAMN05428997_11429 [Bosea sp. CRIB-10]